MKISEFLQKHESKFPGYIQLIKKWTFYIAVNEQAYFLSKYFNMKITKLDKNTIKVWFPVWSKTKWTNILKKYQISYVIYEKNGEEYVVVEKYDEKKYNEVFQINVEDYKFTYDRILQNSVVKLEEKNEKNFLLQEKLEEFYIILLEFLIKMPAKERYFIRQHIELLFFKIYDKVVLYKYNLEQRSELSNEIFTNTMLLREYIRFLNKIWKIKKEGVFLDMWWKIVEVLKILKVIKNRLLSWKTM